MTSQANTFDDNERKVLSLNLTAQDIEHLKWGFIGLFYGFLLGFLCYPDTVCDKNQVPHLKVVSMKFTAELNNHSTTQYVPLATARWDLSIRVPHELVGNYICPQGDLQASVLYKNVTLVTSSLQSYNKLGSDMPKLLRISVFASGEDLIGPIAKEIMEAIKGRKVVRFGSRLSLTDCRAETKTWRMTYECNEAALRFKLESDQIMASEYGNYATCAISL